MLPRGRWKRGTGKRGTVHWQVDLNEFGVAYFVPDIFVCCMLLDNITVLADSYTTNNTWNKPRLVYSIVNTLLNCAVFACKFSFDVACLITIDVRCRFIFSAICIFMAVSTAREPVREFFWLEYGIHEFCSYKNSRVPVLEFLLL